MPKQLPDAPEDTRALAARDDGDGYDTQIASFFGAAPTPDEESPTLIESADFGRTARDRARHRTQVRPATMVR